MVFWTMPVDRLEGAKLKRGQSPRRFLPLLGGRHPPPALRANDPSHLSELSHRHHHHDLSFALVSRSPPEQLQGGNDLRRSTFHEQPLVVVSSDASRHGWNIGAVLIPLDVVSPTEAFF